MSHQPRIYKQGGTSSYQTVNSKYNFLQSQLANLQASGLPTSSDLFDVLTNGDDAGGLNITNVNNLDAVTINGSAYPPVTPTLSAVMTAGNSVGSNDLDMNSRNITNVVNINGSAYPPTIPVDTLSDVLTAGNTADNSIVLTDGVLETMTLQKKQLSSANDDGTGILTNATLKNDFGGQQYLSFGSSVPFGYSNNLSVQLASGGSSCGITHFDSFPTPSDFTISTDQNLALSSSKNFTLSADNIDIGTSQIVYPTLAVPERIRITNQGINCDNTTGAGYAWYRNASAYISNTANTIYTLFQNNLISMLSALSSTYISAGNMIINMGTTGGISNPILTLNQNDTASGSAGIRMFKNISTNGSSIGEIGFVAKTAISGNPEREYARIGSTIRSNTSSNVDGAINLQARINDVLVECMRINGQDSQIEIYQPLDLNDKDIVSSIGDIELNATASAGNGDVIITAKRNVDIDAGTAGDVNINADGAGRNINLTASAGSIALTATTDNMVITGGTLLELNSADLRFTNTTTSASTPNHTSALATTSNIGDITTYLKVKLNGVDIWLPYFTQDPSV
ncbi:glycoprotein repeat domain-containing protein [Dishui Lake virophage 2]|nr:glycoprotein repeat domain-containing protein [Dishui Lake virophage 2]